MAYHKKGFKYYRRSRSHKRFLARATRLRNLHRYNRMMRPTIVRGNKATNLRGAIVPLRYCDIFTVGPSGGAGLTIDRLFRANSCFDPDYTGVGHQPSGFDQWAAFYDHYVVLGSKITVTVSSQASVAGADQAMVVIYLDDDTAGGLGFDQIMENSRYRAKAVSLATGGKNTVVVKNYFSAKQFFGITNVSDNVDRIGAVTTANPVDDAYFRLSLMPASGSTSTLQTFNVAVQIDFKVWFSEPRTLPLS